ncbi:MAG: TonB-dependent receptor plug domain-containing protein [Marinilabiliaceae bacterium]|nr:TonB-dependent receptor plug domain-containing protein [Marinilabiliaceae bacterium]
MRQQITKFTFCLVVAIFSIPYLMFSQENETKKENNTDKQDMQFLSLEELEELMNQPIYSVSKQEEKLAETPMSVYQISKDEINRWGVRYLYETLGRVPGYTFYNTDYYGQYGVMARGWQSIWRYGYSIELMPVVDFGHHSFPSEFFGNIEAVRGPAGLAWGSSANAGLVNANLRSDLNGAELVAQYGNHNQYSVSALYGSKFKDNNGSMFFGFNQKGQDYEIQKNAFGQPGNDWKTNGVRPSYSFVGKVHYKNFKSILFVEHNDHYSPQLWFADAYSKNANTNEWEETSYADFWNDIDSVTGDAPHDQLNVICYRMEYALPIKNDNVSVSLYHNYYNRIWYFEPVASLGDHKRDIGFNANIKLMNDNLNISLGSDIYGQQRINMYTNNHTFAVERGVDWFSNSYKGSDISYNNAFFQASYKLMDDVKLIGGARIDHQDDGTFSDNIVFFRAGAVYNITNNHVVKYFYNKAPRRPQVNERSLTSPNAEDLDAHELAFVGKFGGKFDYSITLYNQMLTNQITRDPNSFNDFINTGGLNVSGIEWAFSSIPVRNLFVYWNGSALAPKVKKTIINNSNGTTTTVAEAHNSDDQPLFVPQFNSFIGAEYNVNNIFKFNVAWRAIYGIPYVNSSMEEKKASTDFMDITMTSKKFWNRLEISLAALNVLDNKNGLPAYGEHAKNQPGIIEPEGMRFYLKTRFTIPD